MGTFIRRFAMVIKNVKILTFSEFGSCSYQRLSIVNTKNKIC